MPFAISQGKVLSISRPSYVYAGRSSVRLFSDHVLSYAAMWRAQPALRTVIGFLARNLASLGVGVYTGGLSDQDRERDRKHPLEAILRNPVPGTKWTQFKLFESMIIERCIYDRAYWLKLKSPETEQVGALLPIPARMVRPHPDSTDWLEPTEYRIEGTQGYIDVKRENLVVFGGYNPEDSREGVSMIETLRSILAEEFSAQAYRAGLWRNGARVGGYLTRPVEAPRWRSDTAKQRFLEEWNAQYGGELSSWLTTGGTPLLEDGMKFEPTGHSPKDAQYIESRKLTREECASAFYLPPSAVGIYESGSSHNSMESQRESLYRDAFPPWCVEIEQDIQKQVLMDLDPAAADGSKYVEFNLQAKLDGGFLDQAKVLQSAIGGPYMTPNEGRKKMNLPSIDGGDELIQPLNVTKGGLASPNDTAPDDPNNEESNERVPVPKKGVQPAQAPAKKEAPPPKKAALERMERSVASKLGAGAPVNWERWHESVGGGLVAAIKDTIEAGVPVRDVFATAKEGIDQ